MKETVMTLCSESIYLIELFMVMLGYVLFTEYKGKHLKTGVVMQVLFIYVFQKISLNVSIVLTGSTEVGVLVNAITGLLVGCCCYKGNIIKKTAVYMIYLGPAIISELTTYSLLYTIAVRNGISVGTIAMFFQTNEYRNLGVIICGQMILALWGALVLLWKMFAERRMIKEYILYLTLPIYQIFIFIIYYSFCGKIRFENVIVGWFLFMFGIIMDVSVIYLINGVFQKLKVEREISKVQEKRQEELAYYMMVNDRMEQSRFLRHEFANQMQVIYGLLEMQDTEKVKQMLDKTREKVEQIFLTEEEGQGV